MNLVTKKPTPLMRGLGAMFMGRGLSGCGCGGSCRGCGSGLGRMKATCGPSGGMEGYSVWPSGTPRIGMGDDSSDLSENDLTDLYDPSLGTAPVTDLSGEVGDSGLSNADLIALNGSIQAGPDYESVLVAPNGVGITSSGQPVTGAATVNSTGSLVSTIGSAISALLAPSPQQAGLVPAASANPTATQILPWVLLGGGALILISAFRK